ncbi:hypothetical protein [Ornithinimicrobium pekingense]|uniref:hypothetical protein n=1 Tax=Ornithinimicrobium pekingense TaxID=384677 RepID=UPI0003B6B44D|nr:hypothetical protein [Ornithinimicrobium pekingense]
MAEQDRPGAGRTSTADALSPGEPEELLYALGTRLAPHREAATTALRDAEREVAQAQEQLARAERAAAERGYTSDPLPFMRDSVREEVEALGRKTTPKKVRTSYRFLLDRAVELAAAEVQGFHDDRAAEREQHESGVDACRESLRRATAALEAARAMHDRVREAEASARRGLDEMVAKLREA